MAARQAVVHTTESTNNTERQPQSRGWKGWRRSVALLSLGSFIALLTNVALLIWATTTSRRIGNTVLIYQGTERKMKSINSALHAVITVLSSILLAGGNACMACMVAPTRHDIDLAHARGGWLDVGVSGFRNLSAVPWKRKLPWLMIAVGCIPLHLLYNSVIYTTTVASNYVATLVTHDFVNGAPFDLDGSNLAYSAGLPYPGQPSLYSHLQHNITSWDRLENADCINTFGVSYVTEYLNVVLISSSTSKNNSILNGWSVLATPEQSDDMNFRSDLGWICGNQNGPCDVGRAAKQSKNWTLPWNNINTPPGQDTPTPHYEQVQVEYCLTQPFDSQCTVVLSIPMLASVIFSNGVQFLFVLWALLMRDFDPIITTGDAIASFMADPDPSTIKQGILSVFDVRKRKRPGDCEYSAKPWEPHRFRWYRAVSVRRWIWTILACMLGWSLALVLLILGVETGKGTYNADRDSLHTLLIAGLGAILPGSLVGFFGQLSTMGFVIIANLPQLFISILYYLYSGVFTCMVMSNEYSTYGSQYADTGRLDPKHKPPLYTLPGKIKNFITRRPQESDIGDLTPQAAGLRVSSENGPRGAQRGTYFLNLPFRCAIPLLLASTSLHFFASQSIFLAQVNTVDNDGSPNQYYYIQACGWSALCIVISLVIGAVMILAMIGFAVLRKYHGGIPVAGSCSLVISAACHGPAEDEITAQGRDRDAAFSQVSYGELGVVQMSQGEETWKAGFGPGRIYQLVEGRSYL